MTALWSVWFGVHLATSGNLALFALRLRRADLIGDLT